MKQKHTQARKANRGPNITSTYLYGLSVFERRVNDILGADHAEFSKVHPNLDRAVEGYKVRLEAIKRQTLNNKKQWQVNQ